MWKFPQSIAVRQLARLHPEDHFCFWRSPQNFRGEIVLGLSQPRPGLYLLHRSSTRDSGLRTQRLEDAPLKRRTHHSRNRQILRSRLEQSGYGNAWIRSLHPRNTQARSRALRPVTRPLPPANHNFYSHSRKLSRGAREKYWRRNGKDSMLNVKTCDHGKLD